MFVFQSDELVPKGYTNSNFHFDKNFHQFTSNFAFTFENATVSWRSVKHSYTTNSTMDVKYIIASKAAKEVVWLRTFLMELRVVPLVV